MTNEQAIELIMSLKWDKNIDEQEDKALSMAIEALEKQARLEALIDMGTEYADRMYKEGNADDE